MFSFFFLNFIYTNSQYLIQKWSSFFHQLFQDWKVWYETNEMLAVDNLQENFQYLENYRI